MTESAFQGYPTSAYHPCCTEAVSVLGSAHDTASYLAGVHGYLEEQMRSAPANEQAEFTARNEELLRAMLTFASSGLDSMIKRLVVDALPEVIDRHPGAQDQFRKFVERRLRRGDGPDYAFVAGVIADPNPRNHLVGELVKDLTSRSLQSVDEVLKVGSYFDIRTEDIIPDIPAARKIFSARNQIVHEMDIDFARPNRNRRSRQYSDMGANTQALFEVALCFLTEVNRRLESEGGTSE